MDRLVVHEWDDGMNSTKAYRITELVPYFYYHRYAIPAFLLPAYDATPDISYPNAGYAAKSHLQ